MFASGAEAENAIEEMSEELGVSRPNLKNFRVQEPCLATHSCAQLASGQPARDEKPRKEAYVMATSQHVVATSGSQVAVLLLQEPRHRDNGNRRSTSDRRSRSKVPLRATGTRRVRQLAALCYFDLFRFVMCRGGHPQRIGKRQGLQVPWFEWL